MKKQRFGILSIIVVIPLYVGNIIAQDGKKMDMANKKKSPHCLVMMAFQQNLMVLLKQSARWQRQANWKMSNWREMRYRKSNEA